MDRPWQSMAMFDQAVAAVLPEVTPHPIVWHYTTPAVAKLILESQAFWATSVETTNDEGELFYGMNLVKRLWDERSGASPHWERIDGWLFYAELALHGERRSDSYVLCASAEEDALGHWTEFGYCALGIATSRLMTKQPKPDASGGRLAPTFTTGWRAVIYNEADQATHASALFEVLEELCDREQWVRGNELTHTDEVGIECILRSIVYIKDPIFHRESEVRLYGQAISTGALVEPHNGKFGPSRHILVRTNSDSDAQEGLPIVEIRIGDIVPEAKVEAEILSEFPSSIPIVLVPTSARIR